MTMKHKTFELIDVKADGHSGEFTALASVFGNVDHVGDRMMPGAFTKTLADWRASGHPIPVILSHGWDDPMRFIGKADPQNVVQTTKGLEVTGHLDIENLDNPVPKQVHRLMKEGLLRGWSFGYTVPDGGEKIDDKGVNEVSAVDLVEVGPTLKGANPEAELQAVKSLVADAITEDEALKVDPQPGEPGYPEDFKGEKNVTPVSEVELADVSEEAVDDGTDDEPSEAKSSPQDPLRHQVNRERLNIALGK